MNSWTGRFIQGHFGLPCLWAVGAAFPVFASWAAQLGRIVGSSAQEAYRNQDTYYVVARFHYVLSIAAWFVVFAVAYLGLSLLLPRFRRLFGLIHFALMIAGAALISAPQFLLAWSGWPRRFDDPQEAFALWNAVSMAGYGLMLGSLGFLVAAVVSGVRTRTPSVEP